MTAVMKREIRNYLKQPLFWLGILLVAFGIFQSLEPYLSIHYISSEKEISEELPESVHDGDVQEGYVPSDEEERRTAWESKMKESLISNFEMSRKEAETVIKEMKGMEIGKACEYLEKEYHYYGAISVYQDVKYHRGTKEEINAYISGKMKEKRFSYYFARKFADFTGLFMGFAATVLLAVLFWQDTRKNTYELLHTKPVVARQYVTGKAAGGFLVCLTALAVLNFLFWALCLVYTKGSGFEVKLIDFVWATCMYILPNMLMIVCVYTLVSLLFKNPFPAVPLLILHMVYSNMGSRNAEGIYGYYGRPLAIMVRFPGPFFDTTPPPMALMNQCLLIVVSIGILLISIQLWKRRRM